MVRCVGIFRYNRVDFIVIALDEYREVLPKSFLNVFGFLFPYEPVFLMTTDEFEQRRFFLVVQHLKGLYLASKFCLVHGTGGCFGAA